MKLVAGLGNPGKKYEGTRHNIGFEVIQLLAQGFATATRRLKFEGHLQECLVGTEKTLLLMPQTFMNLSGRSIRQVMDFYKIDNEDLLVVCDDFNIPLGTLRLRAAGSDRGAKGTGQHVWAAWHGPDFAFEARNRPGACRVGSSGLRFGKVYLPRTQSCEKPDDSSSRSNRGLDK